MASCSYAYIYREREHAIELRVWAEIQWHALMQVTGAIVTCTV